MDGRQKRKRLSEANHQLLAKNIVNKPIDVGRNAATVNGEPRRKKLKTMADLDKHDHLTSSKIKNENERQTENTRASSKRSVSSSLLKAPNLDKVSPAAWRTISRKAHAKSSIRPKVPRNLLAREDNMQSRDIDASQSQKLGGTFEFKRKEASKFTGTTST
nr:cullin, conserved site-containing protein [Tanacetum cinerariifolium]